MPKIFEIINIDGVVTRRGTLNNNSINIDIREDDYGYIIRDADNPDKIHSQGMIKKSTKEMRKEAQDIVITPLVNGKVEITANLFKEGHKTLIVKDEQGRYQNEHHLPSEVMILELPKGKYSIHSKEKKSSNVVSFTHSAETVLDIATPYLESVDNAHIKNLVEQKMIEQGIDASAALHTVMNELVQAKDHLSISAFNIISRYERVFNSRCSILNEGPETKWEVIIGSTDYVKVDSKITRVLIYEHKEGIKLFEKELDMRDKKVRQIFLSPQKQYMIDAYVDDDFVSSRLATSPHPEMKELMWADETSNIRQVREAMEQGLLINSGNAMTQESQEVYAIKSKLSPSFQPIERPLMSARDQHGIEFFIADRELLGALRKKFYFVLKPYLQVFSSNKFIKKEIKSNYVSIDYYGDGIILKDDYMYWVEDENGAIVSESGFLSFDESKQEDITEELHSYELSKYENRLIGFINAYKGTTYDTIIRESLSEISTQQDFTIENAYKKIIEKLSRNAVSLELSQVVSLIMQDSSVGRVIDSTFFDAPIRLERAFNELHIPEVISKQYIVKIDTYTVETSSFLTRYVDDQARRIVMKGTDYAIVSFIDRNSYVRSGFAVFSLGKYNNLLGSWKLETEVF